MAMYVFNRGTRPVCDMEHNMTGCMSKSRKFMIIPRKNGKSWMTTVKSLIEAVGEEEASKIIAEVERGMES